MDVFFPKRIVVAEEEMKLIGCGPFVPSQSRWVNPHKRLLSALVTCYSNAPTLYEST